MSFQQVVLSLVPSLITIITVYVTMEKKLAVQEVLIKQLSKEIDELKQTIKEMQK